MSLVRMRKIESCAQKSYNQYNETQGRRIHHIFFPFSELFKKKFDLCCFFQNETFKIFLRVFENWKLRNCQEKYVLLFCSERLVVVFCFVGIRFVRETKVLLRLTFLEKPFVLYLFIIEGDGKM